jgi:cell division protein ZipA
MPELRWILLVLGAVLVAGLWWWESKRSEAKNASPPDVEASGTAQQRHEPTFDEEDATSEAELAPVRIDERSIPRGDPPVVTLDDLPEDVDRVVLAPTAPEPRRVESMTARRDVPGSVVPEIVTIGDDDEPTAIPSMRADAAPSTATSEVMRPESSARREAVPAPSAGSTPTPVPAASASVAAQSPPATPRAPAPAIPARPAAAAPAGTEARRPAARSAPPPERRDESKPPEPPSQLQKIVALRLVAVDGTRIDGARLRASLEAEGMRFGKYSIFHRQRVDGRALYSVASLLEPGSFDPDRMDAEQYPGISLFAVFPGPIEAPEAFDDLLACARRLAERLPAVPQDERGVPLGAQRALAIREELVHFQGLVNKTRRPSG